MGRGQSAQVANQGMQQSSEDQANAQSALGSIGTSLGNYNGALNNFLKSGRSIYGANGEYMADQNTLANQTASAGATATGGALALNAERTGENTSGYGTTLASAKSQAAQNVENELASADATRLQNLMAVNQYGVQAEQFPAQVYGSIYGTSTSGASGELGDAANAAKTPGFWDEFAPALVGGASSVGAGFTPNG
jgi:hypothetical protein